MYGGVLMLSCGWTTEIDNSPIRTLASERVLTLSRSRIYQLAGIHSLKISDSRIATPLSQVVPTVGQQGSA